ncbi:MAG: AbrB family transcriptional regulator [Alphaproteobacteria bacterium]|nr:AbrB family transcriptional regulator [Alphaproteobacteria bacterium]
MGRPPIPEAATGPAWTWPRLALTLAIGGVGGLVAAWLRMPLAWMIGAMLAVTAAALMRAPVGLPMPLRRVMITVLGVMLGSTFSPEIVDRAGAWAISLIGLLVYIIATGVLLWWLLRRFAGYDHPTAFFAGMPGGLNEMVILGAAAGGDDRTLALTHSLRVLLVVLIIPIWFRLTIGYDTGGLLGPAPKAAPGWLDLAILIGCAVVGAPTGRLVRLPAPDLVGPMMVSAIVHLTGLTASSPPPLAIAAAQLIIGSAIGCRFAGASVPALVRVARIGIAQTIAMILISLGFAVGLSLLTGAPVPALLLAYAPGGLAEMSLIALYLDTDTAFVATHHIIRIFLVVSLASLLFTVLTRLWGPAAKAGNDKAMTKD